MKRIIGFILALTIAAVLLSGCALQTREPLRLHIIANSNSDFDQSVKLRVRDDLLNKSADAMAQMKSLEQAESYVREHIREIEDHANHVLAQNGAGYRARVSVGVGYFPEKQYGGRVYPAGDYHSVQIVLGEGNGKNWWCVLFPPLCIVAMNGPPDAYTDTDEEDGWPAKITFRSIFESFSR